MKMLSLVTLSTLCTLCVNAQTLQSVTDSGNYTTKNVWIGMAPVGGVTENALNVGGKMKLLGNATDYTAGTDGTQPTIYRSGVNGLTYPFDTYDNLILQAGTVSKDLVFVTGSTPTLRMVVKGNGNVGIGTSTPAVKLEVGGSGPAITQLTNNSDGLDAVGSLRFSMAGTEIGRIESERVVASGRHGALKFYVRTANGLQECMRINQGGNIEMGTSSFSSNLTVNGLVKATKVKVTQNVWADFVFEPTYVLPSLQELEDFIKKNKHLPDIPSAKEVQQNGIDLGEMNAKLLQKIEELTLYIIALNKKHEVAMTELYTKHQALESRIAEIAQTEKTTK